MEESHEELNAHLLERLPKVRGFWRDGKTTSEAMFNKGEELSSLILIDVLPGRAYGGGDLLYGFAKNEQENIGPDELASLREIAAAWLEADADRIAGAVEAGELQEVEHGEDGT